MVDIKTILKKMMDIIPLQNKVVLESNPDLSDNTYSLFEKMVEEGYNKKYKFYWLVQEPKQFSYCCIPNVRFVKWNPQSAIEKIRKLWTLYTAKYIIVCNKYIEKRRSNQVVVALGHGTILKSVKQYQLIGKDCDFTLCPSEFFVDIYCEQLGLSRSQLLISGYPRNDLLFGDACALNKIIETHKYRKIIIWMPTFRQQKHTGRVDSDFDFKLGIPLIYDEAAMFQVNDLLQKENALMILKPHPAQDMTFIKTKRMSNFLLLDDQMLECAGIKLYQILPNTDALITDYSSIFYDYLLLNKPIGITLDDFKEYNRINGFPFRNVLDVLKGEYMYSLKDLLDFIKRISNEEDLYQEERRKINDKVNQYQEGGYSEFVLRYLKDKKGF